MISDMLDKNGKIIIRSELSEVQKKNAIDLWNKGYTLQQIATTVECTIYDLSPWLYKEYIDSRKDK